jgi:hypothetical protein
LLDLDRLYAAPPGAANVGPSGRGDLLQERVDGLRQGTGLGLRGLGRVQHGCAEPLVSRMAPLTVVILPASSRAPPAASPPLREICWVETPCSSTAAAISVVNLLMPPMISLIERIATTASAVEA